LGLNTTTVGDAVVRVYDKREVTQLQNLEVPLLDLIPDSTDHELGGKGFYFGITPSGDEGYGFIHEEAPIPAAQNEQTLQAVVGPVVFVGAVRVTGLARAISMRNAHAFANQLQYHLDMKMRRMTVYWEGALFRDGTGRLADVNGAPVGNTLTIDGGNVMWFRRNMVLDVRRASNLTVKPAIVVTDVDFAAQAITVSDATGILDNDQLYLAGTQPNAGAPIEREFTGLDRLCSATGTYLGQPRASIPEWEGNTIDAAGNDITEDLLLQAENRVMIVGGVSMSEVRNQTMIWHPNQRRKYFRLVLPQKQYAGLDMDAGYRTLRWNDAPIYETHNCPEERVWRASMSKFQKFVTPEGELQIDTTFGPPIKWAQGFDAGLAYFRFYGNYAGRKPNAFALIDRVGNVAAGSR
jgi:hypothetical protein